MLKNEDIKMCQSDELAEKNAVERLEVERISGNVQMLKLTTEMSKHLVSQRADFVSAQIEMGQLGKTTEQILSAIRHHRLDSVASKIQMLKTRHVSHKVHLFEAVVGENKCRQLTT